MKKIRILDDVYWKYICEDLSKFLPNFEYPVKDNVKTPIPFLSEIENWDIVCLDNYFLWDYREEALWDDFLWQYLKLWEKCKIIWISNIWIKLIDRFQQRCISYNQGHVIWFITSKSWKDIADFIKDLEF